MYKLQAHGYIALHNAAHRECFIANSVRTEVLCGPMFAAGVV